MRKSFDRLQRIWPLLAAIYVALALFPATARAASRFFGGDSAAVLVYIDKTSQQMTVFLDGAEKYRWPVSTGRPGYATPSGTFTATSMNEIWYSKEYDNAPMPHAIFFMRDGHAIHGTLEVQNLGRPVSHGCVRISPQNAATLFELVRANGMANTKVVLTGSQLDEVATRQPSPRRHSPAQSSKAASRNRPQGNDQQPWSFLNW